MNNQDQTSEYTEVPTRLEFNRVVAHLEGHCGELAALRTHAEKIGDVAISLMERTEALESQLLVATIMFNVQAALFTASMRRASEREDITWDELNTDLTERALEIAKTYPCDGNTPVDRAIRQSNAITIEQLTRRLETLRGRAHEP